MDLRAPPPSCFIAELPDELLVAIAMQLRVERGFLVSRHAEKQRLSRNLAAIRSLHSMALVCRKFTAIATPVLYQSIVQAGHDFFPRLFRTLLDNPKLGRHVRYLELGPLRDLDYTLKQYLTKSYRERYESLLLQAREVLIEAETAHPTPSLTRRAWALPCPGPLTVLLNITENFQEIALRALPGSVFELACRYTSIANKFNRVWLKKNSTAKGNLRIHVLEASPDAPCGELSRFLVHYKPRRPPRCDPAPCMMQDITIDNLDVSPAYIDGLLQGCATLKRFTCRWSWTDDFIPGHPVDLPALWQSLQHVRHTLTHLTIDTSESAWQVGMDRNIPALGSLRDFSVLTYLEVPELVLWGDDDSADPPPLASILPPSLEMLILKTEWDDDIEDALRELSTDCTEALPRLKEVECTWRPVPRFVASHLIKAFRFVGVDLKLELENDSE